MFLWIFFLLIVPVAITYCVGPVKILTLWFFAFLLTWLYVAAHGNSEMYSHDGFTTEQLVWSGVAFSLFGFFAGIRGFFIMFASIGMVAFFSAWLTFIGLSGEYPINQPWQDNYTPTAEEQQRIDAIDDRENLKWDYDQVTAQESSQTTKDYVRCLQHNVCMRKFAH